MRAWGMLVAVLCAFLLACLPAVAADQPSKPAGMAGDSSQVARGKYLATIGGCNDCHSPKRFTEKGPVVNEELLLSGHPQTEKLPAVPADTVGPGKWGGLFNGNLTAWVGPWGTSFASNLTPDRETGLGGWTEADFIKSLRMGQTPGGRPLLPPMPWQDIGKLNDQDLKALFAYLKSIRPIRNMVPSPIPPTGR